MAALIYGVLASQPPPKPYLAAMLFGFALGGFGHMIHSSLLIASGIVVIGVTTGLFLAAGNPTFGG